MPTPVVNYVYHLFNTHTFLLTNFFFRTNIVYDTTETD